MTHPRLLIPVLTCLGLLAIPLGLVPSQVMNYLTGMLQAGSVVEFSRIWPVMALFFLATVGVAGLDIIKTFLTGLVLEQKVQNRILRIFDRLLRTSPDFYRKNEPAKVSKRVTNETRQVEFFWLNLKLGLPITLIGLLGFGYVLFFGIDQNTALIGQYVPADYSQKGNWFLASLIIMLAPLQSAFLLFDKKIQTVNRRAMIVDDDLANISLETLDSVAEIRSHFAFDYALSRVKINLDRLRRVEIDITKLNSIFSGLGPVLDGLAKVFLLGMGARLCLGDLQIPVTDITVTGIEWKDYLGFAGMAMVVNGYVKNLGTSLLQWRMFKETIRRVEEYDNLPIDFFVAEEAPTIAGDKDKILFNKLSFETTDGTRILNDLNFTIKPGEHVAFVGPSGCGKSTTMNLLIRELQQTAGELQFNDKNISDCNFVSLAEEVGQVRQKPILLAESLRDNILFGLQQTSTRSDQELNSRLVEVVEKVGLKKDILKKALDNSLPEAFSNSSLVSALPNLRSRIIETIQKDHSELVEPFVPQSFLRSGTLLENILYGMPGGKESQSTPDAPVSAVVQRVFKILHNEPLYDKLLWLGQQLFLNDQNVAMRVRFQSPKLFEVLSAYRLAGNQAEELAQDLGQIGSSTIGALKKTKVQHQQLLVSVALETDARLAVRVIPDDSFKEEVLAIRQKVLQETATDHHGVHSFSLETVTGTIPLRQCLLGGRVNLEMHGALNTLDDIILSALQESSLSDVLLLAGLEAPAGAKGQYLSGGQAMKVAIARILFKDPNILLLDEATAALDEKSQAQIVAMIQNDFKDKTVISISHRLSTIRDYDRILVFDRGQVVQEGTYDELLAEEGLFQEMLQQEAGSSKASPAKHVDATSPLPTAPHKKPYESSEIQRAIALSPVFANMPSDQIMLLEHMSNIVKCPKDTVLFQRGDEGEELFIVLNGEVEFFVQRPDNSAAEIIDRCGTGGTFGELALFGNVPRTLSARTSSNSQFCILKSDDIEKLVEIHPGIALSLLETVSRRVANLRDTMYAAESGIK